MSTPTLGQRAAAALKEAKAKGPVSWDEVAAVIDRCASKPKPALLLSICEAIYGFYPRKVGRTAALKAIARAAERLSEEQPTIGDTYGYLLGLTQTYAKAVATWPEADRQYVPHPATWFNQGRYNDDPKEWVRGTPSTTATPRDYGKI